MICSKCGAKYENGNFCVKCGGKLISEETQDVIICSNCGTTNNNKARFCNKCGEKLSFNVSNNNFKNSEIKDTEKEDYTCYYPKGHGIAKSSHVNSNHYKNYINSEDVEIKSTTDIVENGNSSKENYEHEHNTLELHPEKCILDGAQSKRYECTNNENDKCLDNNEIQKKDAIENDDKKFQKYPKIIQKIHNLYKKNPSSVLIVGIVALVIFICLLNLFITWVSACNHEWTKATCTNPKTCVKCGETEGFALGHEWTKATCITPAKCKRCGEIGETIDHDVKYIVAKESTCKEEGLEKGNCIYCGKEFERKIPLKEHSFGEWQIVENPQFGIAGKKLRTCTVCQYKDEQDIPALSTKDVSSEMKTWCDDFEECVDKAIKQRKEDEDSPYMTAMDIEYDINNIIYWKYSENKLLVRYSKGEFTDIDWSYYQQVRTRVVQKYSDLGLDYESIQ